MNSVTLVLALLSLSVTMTAGKQWWNRRALDEELKEWNLGSLGRYKSSKIMRGGPSGSGHLVELDIFEPEPVEGPSEDFSAGGGNSNSPYPGWQGGRYTGWRSGAANDTIERALGNRSNRRGGNSGRNRGSNSVVRTGNKSKGNNQQGGGQRGNSVRRRRVKRNAMKDSRRYWPNKTLVYKYTASSFSQDEQDVFASVIAEYEKYTCITLKERTGEQKYVDIQRGGGCWSTIGYNFWRNGPQYMSLGSTCLRSKKTAIHEFMHSLGVYHQHTRPDRDDYITVHDQNIADGAEDNFAKKSESDVNTYNIPYAYESVMHYGSSYFAKSSGLKTITTKPDSSKESILGRSPTFAFEDIELLSKLYKCEEGCGPANCPAGGFQGKDCRCYCKSNDPSDPVFECGSVCVEPDQECACTSRSGACSGVPDSTCSSSSQSCECDSGRGYASHQGECVQSSAIRCTELEVDCKCSLNSGACSSADLNSVCNSGSNKCVCKSGYQQNENGICVNINDFVCDDANKPCFCNNKGSSACMSVTNSQCDTDTGSCECKVGFYNNRGTCNSAPACSVLGTVCHCSVQDSNVCSSISNTVCDSFSDACVCDPATHREEGGVCVSANRYYIDGSSVSPLTSTSASTNDFVPTSGSDVDDSDVPSNSMYLYAKGTGTGQLAEMASDWLTISGDWCMDFRVKWHNAKIYTLYEFDNGAYGWSYTHAYDGTYSSYKSRTKKQNISSGRKMKFKIKVEPYSDGSWNAAVDPVKIYKC